MEGTRTHAKGEDQLVIKLESRVLPHRILIPVVWEMLKESWKLGDACKDKPVL